MLKGGHFRGLHFCPTESQLVFLLTEWVEHRIPPVIIQGHLNPILSWLNRSICSRILYESVLFSDKGGQDTVV